MPCITSYGTKSESVITANNQAISALQQLLTLASGSLVLTLTFLKNVTGLGTAASKFNWVIQIGWFLLMLSVWLGWVSMAEASKQTSLRGNTSYLFAYGRLHKLAKSAQWCFCLGLVSITIYGIFNLNTVPVNKNRKSESSGNLKQVSTQLSSSSYHEVFVNKLAKIDSSECKITWKTLPNKKLTL